MFIFKTLKISSIVDNYFNERTTDLQTKPWLKMETNKVMFNDGDKYLILKVLNLPPSTLVCPPFCSRGLKKATGKTNEHEPVS